MYGDPSYHPQVNTTGGITVKQEMAVRFAEAMLANPQYMTVTAEEIADQAVRLASALCNKL